MFCKISIPIFLYDGIFVKKLPFPALGSIIKSKLLKSYLDCMSLIHLSTIDGE